jgi:hypothetical protein
LNVKQAVLKSFDPITYTAAVRISGSYKSYLENIAVARNLPAAELVPGRGLAVVFFDEFNPAEAVVIAVYIW